MNGIGIVDVLNHAKNILLLPHVNMDGDALGSVLALYWTFHRMGKTVRVIVEEAPPENLQFLPGSDQVMVYQKGEEDEYHQVDLVLAVDTADLERLGARGRIFRNAQITMNIDHHPTNTKYATYNWVVSDAAATGEVIYSLLKDLGEQLDKEIATCLYGAIASDTGGFRFSNTSSFTHQIAGELIKSGANSSDISMQLFEDVSMNRLKVLAEIIHLIELHHKGRIAMILLPKEVIERFQATEEEINGYSNLGRSIRGVEVAVFIREKQPGEFKISMRSRQTIDLTDVAIRFGGGGHKRAAGFNYVGNLNEIKEQLLKEFMRKL
jgi:bifunctional oligoribonuclease and PAP phosphatase NrnA